MDQESNPDLAGLKPERIQQELEELESNGWQANVVPLAVERSYQFPNYSETLNFLIEVGTVAEEFGPMPAIAIEAGTEVTVRIGREPAPGLTEAEIELATAFPVVM